MLGTIVNIIDEKLEKNTKKAIYYYERSLGKSKVDVF